MSDAPATAAAPKRARPVLTEDEIVAAALSVIRRDGVDGLSMRRLSRELGVSAMAAYYYVANKEELLDLVAARALADISVPTNRELAWHVRLRILIDRIDTQLRFYRGVGEVLLDRMRSTQPHIMRGMMELFEEAGFDDAGILMAYATVHTYLFGRYRVSVEGPPARDGTEQPDDDIVVRLRPKVATLRGRDYYEFGVDALIAGLQAQLEARVRRRQASGS